MAAFSGRARLLVWALPALLGIMLGPEPLAAKNHPSGENLLDMSLEDLLQLRVSVTSLIEKPVDEAPGVVSVITREEIESSGARNLDDLLVLVPGLVPGQDEQNARGYGVRGLWAMEGKILVLLDGVRMNEPLYGNTVFARQFTADMIERIEIIRGPASSVYGEFGELAVLNIVSRSPEADEGAVALTYGLGRETYNRRTASAGWWGHIRDMDVSVTGNLGDGHLGNGDYTDKYGETFRLKDFAGQDYWILNAGIGRRELSIRFIGSSLVQHSHMEGGIDSTGQTYAGPTRPLSTKFESHTIDGKYSWKAADGITVTPRVTYYSSRSWTKDEEWVFDAVTTPSDAGGEYRDFPNKRITAGVSGTWNLGSNMTVVLGGEWRRETIEAKLPSVARGDPWGYYYFYGDDTTKVSSELHSFFGEYDIRTRLVDVTVGGRIDKNNRYKVAHLPRLALTRRLGAFYLKGLASRAYHPPTLMTIAWLDPEIEPEYAKALEAEVGYKPSSESLFRMNVFSIDMKPVILYSGMFSNATARSRGVEAEACLQNRRGRLAGTYSYYHAHYDDLENTMAADENGTAIDGVTLGFPAHKITLAAKARITRGVSLNLSGVWLSERYNRSSDWFWNGVESDYIPVNKAIDGALFVNVYVRGVRMNGWEAGMGVFNLLDEKYSSLTGSYIGSPPVPGPSREFIARIGYSF